MYTLDKKLLDRLKPPQSISEAFRILTTCLVYEIEKLMGMERFNEEVDLFNNPSNVTNLSLFEFITRDLPEAAKDNVMAVSQMNATLVLAPDYFIEATDDGDGSSVESAEAVRKGAEKGERIVLQGLLLRPGVGEFMSYLEYKFYKPGTEENKDFKVYYTCIPPRDLDASPMVIMSLPVSEMPKIQEALKVAKLRLSREGLTTIMFDKNGEHKIPLYGKNVYSLMNESDSPVYGASMEQHKKLILEEDERIQALKEAAGVGKNAEKDGEEGQEEKPEESGQVYSGEES